MDERDQRIARCELLFNECRTAAESLSAALQALADASGKFAELEAYYGGGEWLSDYEADEAGLLPKDLLRGVLSEDGLHDLLAEYDALMLKMREMTENGRR